MIFSFHVMVFLSLQRLTAWCRKAEKLWHRLKRVQCNVCVSLEATPRLSPERVITYIHAKSEFSAGVPKVQVLPSSCHRSVCNRPHSKCRRECNSKPSR